MRAAWILFLHSFARARTVSLVIALLLALFQVVLVLVARSLNGQFAELGSILPPFVRTLMGPAFASFLSFSGIVSLGYYDPPVLAASIGLAVNVGTRLALEVESGFIDSVLARPIARHWLVTRSIAVAIVSIGVVVLAMMFGTWAGLTLLVPDSPDVPSREMVLRLAGNLWLQCVTWSAVSLALAAPARRRGIAAGAAGILALVAFLLDYVARLWDAAKPFGRFSPFAYFNPLIPLVGEPPSIRDLAVLAAVTITAWTLAYVLFLRRDVAR